MDEPEPLDSLFNEKIFRLLLNPKRNEALKNSILHRPKSPENN